MKYNTAWQEEGETSDAQIMSVWGLMLSEKSQYQKDYWLCGFSILVMMSYLIIVLQTLSLGETG